MRFNSGQEPIPTPEERDERKSAAIISFRKRSKEIMDARRAAAEPKPQPGQTPEDFAEEQEFWSRIRKVNDDKRAKEKSSGISYPPYARRRVVDPFRAERRNSRLEIGVSVAGLALVTAISLGTSLVADANYGNDKAKQFAEDQGYKDARVTDKHLLFPGFNGCDASDRVAYDIEAKVQDPSSLSLEPRDLVICVGLFKDATLRDRS